MTNATDALQAAIIAAIDAHPALNMSLAGVYDGTPVRAAFPYLVIGDGVTSDWSTKTAQGREVQLMLTLWADGEGVAPLPAMMAQVEEAVAAIPRDLAGWRIASLVFLRSRIVRDPAGPWAGLVDHRVRLLAA
jgi:Protein of unknown function (DUF3168)